MRIPVLPLLILSAVLTLSQSVEDPELHQCKQLCQQQQQFDPPLKRECLRLCEDYAKRKAARERETAAGSQEEPESELNRCKHQCRLAEQEEKQLGICEHWCKERYDEKKKEEERGGGRDGEDPEARRQICGQQCVTRHDDQRGQQECKRECEERYIQGGEGTTSEGMEVTEESDV